MCETTPKIIKLKTILLYITFLISGHRGLEFHELASGDYLTHPLCLSAIFSFVETAKALNSPPTSKIIFTLGALLRAKMLCKFLFFSFQDLVLTFRANSKTTS